MTLVAGADGGMKRGGDTATEGQRSGAEEAVVDKTEVEVAVEKGLSQCLSGCDNWRADTKSEEGQQGVRQCNEADNEAGRTCVCRAKGREQSAE